MVIDKICKMTVKGVKSKSESFFSISHGVLELWRKTLRGGVGADFIMGRKVPEWADSQLSSFLGQPVMELVPKWARVPNIYIYIYIYI